MLSKKGCGGPKLLSYVTLGLPSYFSCQVLLVITEFQGHPFIVVGQDLEMVRK